MMVTARADHESGSPPSSRKSPRPRGRPRSFDSAAALVNIRHCFARCGYAGTSLDELASATGLARPSLYNAFGDKHAMFLRALDSEYGDICARFACLNESGSLPSRIGAFLEAATAGYGGGRSEQTSGIAFGAGTTEAATDPGVRAKLRQFNEAFDGAAGRALGRHTSSAAVSLLSAFALSLCIRSRSNASWSLDDLDLTALTCVLESCGGGG